MSQPEVARTILGNTDLEVSRLCFGTYKLGTKLEPSAAIDLLGKAYDGGINFIDTSDNYPAAELLIGQALREGALPRDDVVIATKTGLAISEYEARAFNKAGISCDTSPERIRRKVGESLRLLGVEAIDLYQVHVHDPRVEPVEIAAVMGELIDEGKIRHWGISNYNEPEAVAAVVGASSEAGLAGPVSLQNYYNLFDRGFEDSVRVAQDLGMTVLAFSPLQKGIISERLFEDIPTLLKQAEDGLLGGLPAERLASIKYQWAVRQELLTLQAFAAKHGYNTQQLAVAWLMSREATIPILGAYSQEYFDDLVQAADWGMDEESIAFVEQVVSDAFSIEQ